MDKLATSRERQFLITESGRTVQRYIRLNELTPPLQQMVDDKKNRCYPAVELSYLKPEEQAIVVETIESEQATPSLSQAQRMKKLSQSGKLNDDAVLSIMSEDKKPEVDKIVLTSDTPRKYFPKSFTPRQMEETIIKLLASWCKKASEESGAVINQITDGPDRYSLPEDFFVVRERRSLLCLYHISLQTGTHGLQALPKVC